MPLVFVHGVATRQSQQARAEVFQRDALFKAIVLPQGSRVLDPDWGSNAVKFNPALPWVPERGTAQPFAFGDQPAPVSDVRIGKLASARPDVAIDVAFEAGLALRAKAATASGNLADALSEKDLETFAAAVRYLEFGPDKTAFDAKGSDAEFLSALESELKPHAADQGASPQAMSFGGALAWIGSGLKEMVAPMVNIGSDLALRAIRRPISEQVALFLGDIFVYLRWRESDAAQGTVRRIFEPIIADLIEAATLRSANDPLIVVGHSLGAVILYDLFSDEAAVQKIENGAKMPLLVDAWITVGAQPSVFADMGLYGTPAGTTADGRLPRPKPVKAWLNVYDYTDVLSFSCKNMFQNVEDFEFDNVTGLFQAHTAYFKRPSFYHRLRVRLNELKQTV